MRLFIGFGIDNNTKEYAYMIQNQLTCFKHVKWVKPANMHLTLVFIGDTDLKKDIITILEKNKIHIQQVFSNLLYIDTLTVFPNNKYPKVIVLTLKNNKEFAALQKKLVMDLNKIGLYIHNNREFNPHITLGRITSNMVANVPEIHTASLGVEISGIRLYSSILLPKGPEYKIEYELK